KENPELRVGIDHYYSPHNSSGRHHQQIRYWDTSRPGGSFRPSSQSFFASHKIERCAGPEVRLSVPVSRFQLLYQAPLNSEPSRTKVGCRELRPQFASLAIDAAIQNRPVSTSPPAGLTWEVPLFEVPSVVRLAQDQAE